MTPEEVHEYQHQMYALRKAEFDGLPSRKGHPSAIIKREAEKLAWRSLTGHVMQFHRDAVKSAGWPSFLGRTFAEVEALHNEDHKVVAERTT